MTTAADRIAQWLGQRGITHAFGIVGGGNVALWDAITRHKKTALVCTHHEQAAAMAAAYYQRVSGRIAVALVTTGAGSTNALTGVVAAHMDRVPLLVISGNEASRYMDKATRVWGVQGYDSSGLVWNVCKVSGRVTDPNWAVKMLDAAADEAMQAPGGPAWIDIPKDMQSAVVE